MLPPQVDVYFRREAITRTSRVTVVFRLLLALPHMIVLAAASIAVTLVAILTWFVALVTAHVPAAFYEVLAWSISYGTRVFAYLFFLTDRWPTFSERSDSPVLVRFPGPHRLNRAAVLFRLVLMIPVGFLADFVNNGLTVASVVGWLVVIVLGRVPQSLFDGTASTIRYQTRYFAYAAMLTARYPGGLFGDVNAPTEPPPIEPGLQPPAPPALNGAARRVVVTFLVLGVLVFIGRGVISAHDNGNQRAEGALTELADI